MKLAGKRILVLGGAGFIGSHLVDQLIDERPSEIMVFDNFCRGKAESLGEALTSPLVRVFEDGGDITQVDVLDKAMEGIDCVFHLAALWLLQCQEYPRSAFKVNIEGTFNVIEACTEHGVRLVYSSSASVYGNAIEIPMTEEHPFNNRTFYGATKIAGEQMLRAFHERYGLDYVAIRYMNVYGPRQDYHGAYVAVVMKILDRIKEGKPPIIYGDGSQSYDFVYVEDVARANILAMEAMDYSDQCYNVGMGKPTTIKEITELLLELTGSDLEPIYEPAGQSFVTNRLGSTDKAREHLGFEAQVELREGLQKLIEWRNSDASSNN